MSEDKTRVYSQSLPIKFICSGCETMDDFLKRFRGVTDQLERWKSQGVELVKSDDGFDEAFPIFKTRDPDLARREGFTDESSLDWFLRSLID